KKGSYQCERCSKVFNMQQSLTRHKWQCEGTRVIECNMCGKSFHRPDRLKAHQMSQHSFIRESDPTLS
ncbi:unnamed protein product, partial [Lymnaea stagnalis]